MRQLALYLSGETSATVCRRRCQSIKILVSFSLWPRCSNRSFKTDGKREIKALPEFSDSNLIASETEKWINENNWLYCDKASKTKCCLISAAWPRIPDQGRGKRRMEVHRILDELHLHVERFIFL